MGFGVFAYETDDETLQYVGSVHKGSSVMDEILYTKEFYVLKN